MWKIWWVLPYTLCSLLLPPRHGAASCYAAAAPAADCTILVKSRVCSSPKRRWTTSVASLHGDQGNGLVIRSCRDSAPHRIRLFSEFRVNLCAVALCNTVLYKRFHPPMQVFIRPMNTDWFRLTQILPFFVLYWRPILCNGSFHCSPTLETAAHCEICLQGISVRTEPFLLQTWDGYQYPKFPAEALERAGWTRRKVWWGVRWERKHPGFQGSKPKKLPIIYL